MARKGERVWYEWALESLDEHGDIIDVDHTTSASAALAWLRLQREEDEPAQVALTRRLESDTEGLQQRSYAYVEEDSLELAPDFDCGAHVPKYLREAWASAVTTTEEA